MSVVQDLYETTKELHDHLQKSFKEEEREEAISTIERLLFERDKYIDQLNPPYSSEEEKLGAEIVSLNQQIDTMLEALQFEIKTDIRRLNQQKEKTNQYANPYDAPPADGMFLDKRK